MLEEERKVFLKKLNEIKIKASDLNKSKKNLPILPIKECKYEDSIRFRKNISKLLRALSLNEVRTYSLVGKKTAELFNKDKNLVLIPNLMSHKIKVL